MKGRRADPKVIPFKVFLDHSRFRKSQEVQEKIQTCDVDFAHVDSRSGYLQRKHPCNACGNIRAVLHGTTCNDDFSRNIVPRKIEHRVI